MTEQRKHSEILRDAQQIFGVFGYDPFSLLAAVKDSCPENPTYTNARFICDRIAEHNGYFTFRDLANSPEMNITKMASVLDEYIAKLEAEGN